jgi:hypothetical protein
MSRFPAVLSVLASAPLWFASAPANADVVITGPRVVVVRPAPVYVAPRYRYVRVYRPALGRYVIVRRPIVVVK